MNDNYDSPIDLFQAVGEFVGTPLEKGLNVKSRAILVDQLDTGGILLYELAEKKRDMRFILLGRRAANLMPKEKTNTDLDRKVVMEGANAQLESDYEFILTLEKIIDQRLELGRLWLQL